MDSKIYDIPTHCKAGVVVNEGPDFQVKVEMVPVPEPGVSLVHIEDKTLTGRARRHPHPPQRHRPLLLRHPHDEE
jgi:hypothetical protein